MSGSGVAGAGIWDEVSNLSFASGRGDLLGPAAHLVQLAQTELNCLISHHAPIRARGLYLM